MSEGNGMRRVVVTGMGAVTALGNDVQSTWDAMVEGRSGIGPITQFDASKLTVRIGGEVQSFDPSSVLDRKEQRRNDRYVQFALVAARQAMDQAGLPARLDGSEAERTGIVIGTGVGGIETLEDQILTLGQRGPDRLSPFLVPMVIGNLASGVAAIVFGPKGPNFAVVSACATGGHSIGEAAEIIRRDDADMMLAGGAEASMTESLVGGFAAMHALSRRNDDPGRASRPFDRTRDGFVIGEGAGVIVLEELGHALARGAEPLAELVGYGATADASHITLPAPGGEGAVRAVRRALQKAAVSPDQVDMLNAHATSTPEGDRTEIDAIRTLFGDHAGTVSVTANKSMIGHTLGAAGAMEAAAAVLSLRDGFVPPTLHTQTLDRAIALDVVLGTARRRPIGAVVSNSFAFGGNNVALVFVRAAAG